MFKIIHGATDETTAYKVDSYPYGRERTECRWWLETATKGTGKGKMRCMQQTLNPKNGRWNKAHGSTYCDFMVLYLDDQQHCHPFHCHINGHQDLCKLVQSGLYSQLNDEEHAFLVNAIKVDATRYNVQEWQRFRYYLEKARAVADLTDSAAVALAIYEQARQDRPTDQFLHERDAEEVVKAVQMERTTGKLISV